MAAAATPAFAQDSGSLIKQRIESVFNIVPQNAADLAIPLTRRALARRSVGDSVATVQPLGYQATQPTILPGPEAKADSVVVAVKRFAALPPKSDSALVESELQGEGDLEQGSAEDLADSAEDLVRIPRPRPAQSEGTAASAEVASIEPDQLGGPLDLVAGAAPEVPEKQGEADGEETESAAPVSPEAGAASIEAEPPAATVPLPQPRPARAEAEPIATAALAVPAGAAAAPQASPAPAEAQQQARTPREDCVAADKLADNDKDFARNAEALDAPGFCLTQDRFKERRRPWTVQTVDSGRPGPLWAVMHDDEDVAFDSAIKGLKNFGGVLVTVDTGGKRNQDGIDPNRNFSDEAISCPKMGKSASPRFTGIFQKLMDPDHPIIALHSNFNGKVPTTGIGHVSMKTVPKKMKVAKSTDPEGPLASEHALVLMAAAEPVEASVDATMKTLSGKGVNVVLETVKGKEGDCSLSNYAVISGHKRYFNVTVDHDEGDKQGRIIQAILDDAARIASAD